MAWVIMIALFALAMAAAVPARIRVAHTPPPRGYGITPHNAHAPYPTTPTESLPPGVHKKRTFDADNEDIIVWASNMVSVGSVVSFTEELCDCQIGHDHE